MDKPIDWDASCHLRDLVGAEEGECARNASRAILDHASELPPGAVYVEGAWNVAGDPDGHAWIETPTAIIDPTLAALPPERRSGSWSHGVIPRQRVWCVCRNKVAEHVQAHTNNPDPRKGKLRPILERGNPLLDHAEHITEGYGPYCECDSDVRKFFGDLKTT